MSKLNVEIDLGDLFAYDEDESVSDIINDAIKREVSRKITSLISDKVSEEASKQCDVYMKDIVKDQLGISLSIAVKKEFDDMKVIASSYSKEKVLINVYIENEIRRNISPEVNKKIKNAIDKTTSEAIKTLQDQYNSLFAETLIKKMYDSEFLSDKAKSILLGNNTQEES